MGKYEKGLDGLLSDILDTDLETAEQYGVLGMKWGVRKDRNRARREARQAAKSAEKEKRQATSDSNKLVESRKASEMTTQELREFNERKRLEAEFQKLNSAPRSKKQELLARTSKMWEDTAFELGKFALTQVGKSSINKTLVKHGLTPPKEKK